jgi:lipopolysaccharide transport system ATP-binding protein
MSIAIRADKLGKLYHFGATHAGSLRELAVGAWKRLFGRSEALLLPHEEDRYREFSERAGQEDGTFWALRDVSFEVKTGEVIGIIGPNGSGKSTLLKILSQITAPTTGRVEIHGHVASLLEVGTGFHPELSGRENVFLNGAILGMTRSEIRRRFDEIVGFSGVDKFIDTPVKRYSSGMYTRLAFSVAIHLAPDILFLDEVLAVGDVAFRQKCLNKIKEMRQKNRTILLVSHSLEAITSFCDRTLLLERGKLVQEGISQKVVESYYESVFPANENVPLAERRDRTGDGSARLISFTLETKDPHHKAIHTDSQLQFTLGYRSDKPILSPQFWIVIRDTTNARVFLFDSHMEGGLPSSLPPEGCVICLTGPINLTPGRCHVDIGLHKENVEADAVQDVEHFDVLAEAASDSEKIPPRNWALCVLRHQWLFKEDSPAQSSNGNHLGTA